MILDGARLRAYGFHGVVVLSMSLPRPEGGWRQEVHGLSLEAALEFLDQLRTACIFAAPPEPPKGPANDTERR